MKREIKYFAFQDGIALKVHGSTQSLVALTNLPNTKTRENNALGVTVIPTAIVHQMAVRDLKCLPGILYFFETFKGTFLGMVLAICGFFAKNYRMAFIGVLLALPYFRLFTQFMSDMINSSKWYRKHFKKTYQHNAALNKVLNAYYTLGRIPTMEEAKKCSVREKIKSTIYDYYIGYSYSIVLLIAFIGSDAFFKSIYFPFVTMGLILITYLPFRFGMFDYLEDYILEEPTDDDIDLALFALSTYEHSEKLNRYLDSLERQLNEDYRNKANSQTSSKNEDEDCSDEKPEDNK